MRKLFSSMLITLLLCGCGGLFNQVKVAMGLRHYFNAVSVNASRNFENSTKFHKLEFKGIMGDEWNKERLGEAARIVAKKYREQMGEKTFAGQKFIRIVAELIDGTSYTFDVEFSELEDAEPYIEVAQKFVDTYMKEDSTAYISMLHEDLRGDSSIGHIHEVYVGMDSITGAKRGKAECYGFVEETYDNDGEDIHLYSVIFNEKRGKYTVFYRVKVERDSKKVYYYKFKA